MKYYLYILLSQDRCHWYIGSTKDIIARLRRHNSVSSKSTKPYRPWKVVYSEEFLTRSDAVKREQFLKTPKGYSVLLSIKNEVLLKF